MKFQCWKFRVSVFQIRSNSHSHHHINSIEGKICSTPSTGNKIHCPATDRCARVKIHRNMCVKSGNFKPIHAVQARFRNQFQFDDRCSQFFMRSFDGLKFWVGLLLVLQFLILGRKQNRFHSLFHFLFFFF